MRKLILLLAVCGLFAFAAPAMAADGTIKGTVTHAVDGSPVDSIYVVAQNTSTGVSTIDVAGSNGKYTFTLSPGTYDISPYTTVSTETNVIFLKKSLTVTIASGETKSGQDFALTRRGKFIGHVYAADGVTPLQDATVSANNANGSSFGYSYSTTLSNGSYIGIPAGYSDPTASSIGSFTFYVTKAGYFGSMVSGVLLAADETTVTQDFSLTPGSVVTGTIVDAGGAALANATVAVTKTSTGATYSSLTNASGVFSVSVYDLTNYNGSAVADYSISVSKTGYITKTGFFSITADGSTVAGNNFTLTAAGTMTGTITTSAGAALSGVTITASDGFGNVYSTTTNSSGVYTLSSCAPSTLYTLTATKTNYVGQKFYNITVSAGATYTKNFALADAKTFSGTVLAKNNNSPIEGATVYLFKRNKTRSEIADFTFVTKSNGSFIFKNVPVGNYRVKIVKNGYVTTVVDSLSIKNNVTGKTYKLDLGGFIQGRIYTGKSTGIGSADISVYSVNNGKYVSYASTTSDDNGYYIVTGLKNGSYRIRVSTSDYVTRIVKANVSSGKKTTTNVKLSSAGSISGYITDAETGLPVSATIRVVGTSISASSDANGFYTLEGVAPGRQRITVVSWFYETPRQKDVTVVAGKIKTLNFTVSPKR